MDNVIYTALSKYFNALELVGFKSDKEVKQLILLLFIYKVYNKYYITEADHRVLQDSLYCMYGTSCLFPYPLMNEGSV